MYGEVYILIALINMISIKYPMELATESVNDLFCSGLTNLQYIRCRTIAMTTSQFYSNFILYTLVSCFELLAHHEHPVFDFH